MNIKVIKPYVDRLMRGFHGCFINQNWELILVPKHNVYFRLEDVETAEEFNCKIIAWCSRPAIKGVPKQTQNKIRKGLNEYFGLSFEWGDWDLVYTKLGNGCNEGLCKEFVRSGYDLGVLKEKKL